MPSRPAARHTSGHVDRHLPGGLGRVHDQDRFGDQLAGAGTVTVDRRVHSGR
jgi:hypothetical protein